MTETASSSGRPEPYTRIADAVPHILKWAEDITEEVGRRFGSFGSSDGSERLGGCICVMDHRGEILLKQIVGKPDPEKAEAYERNAELKCRILFEHQYDAGNISSWQYRNPTADTKIWGGGVYFKSVGGYMSYSGFTEIADEGYIVAFGRWFEFVPENEDGNEQVERIRRISGLTDDLVEDIWGEFEAALP